MKDPKDTELEQALRDNFSAEEKRIITRFLAEKKLKTTGKG